jgi:HK97 family phage major capsid protein/HK97 family phage prohead protease
MNRSYSWISVRAVDEDKRTIEGVATTPMQARDGDVLVTEGIQFKLPIPFLYRHSEPFGNVTNASVKKDGIRVRVQVAPAGVSPKIDEYWNLVKSGTVRGLSIGWRTLEEAYDKTIAGFRIYKSEWLELSAVPVPADPNATITSVRSMDAEILAALGREVPATARRTPPTTRPGVSGQRQGKAMPKGIQERIASFEASIEQNRRRMTEIVETSEAAGNARLTDEESREYDPIAAEVTADEKELSRLQVLAGAARKAQPAEEPLEVRMHRPIAPTPGLSRVERVELPKGTGFTRACIALIRANGNHFNAAQMAQQFYKDTPEVAAYLRATVAAGDTTTSGWASQLIPSAQQLASEFIDLLRPATLLGRIPGLRRVPFNIAIPIGSTGTTGQWVGESRNKPVGAPAFSSATLRWAKAAQIVVISEELARFSSPSAEAIIRDLLIKGLGQFLDGQFVDPNVAEVSNVSPASILNGKNAVGNSSGPTAADFRVDMNALFAAFISNNQDPTTAVVLMSATSAMGLAAQVNALGQPEFPSVTMTGGSILGVPVVVSETVSDRLILVNASDILFADDGGVRVDVSREATIEMSDAPATGEESPATDLIYHNMFQRNEVALRAERFITWKKARASSVEWIDNCAYAPQPPAE